MNIKTSKELGCNWVSVGPPIKKKKKKLEESI